MSSLELEQKLRVSIQGYLYQFDIAKVILLYFAKAPIHNGLEIIRKEGREGAREGGRKRGKKAKEKIDPHRTA